MLLQTHHQPKSTNQTRIQISSISSKPLPLPHHNNNYPNSPWKTPARLVTCSDVQVVTRGPEGEPRRPRRRLASQTPLRVHAPPTSITRGVVGEERVVVGGGGREVARRKRDRRVGRAPVGPRDVTRAESISMEPYLRRRSLTTREIQSRSVRGGLHDR